MKSNKELIEAVIQWIDEYNYETYSLSIGSSRDLNHVVFANALAEYWEETPTWVRIFGGFVIAQTDWPENAASWLSQAKELNKDQPDAIVIISTISSGIAILKRLSEQKNWSAAHTFFLCQQTKTHEEDIINILPYDGLKLMNSDGKKWIIKTTGLQHI